MSRTFISGGKRLNVLSAPVAHAAGDLIYYNGFYGVAQDDWVVGSPAVLIMDAGEQKLTNIFGSTIAMGTKMLAVPTAIATSLLLYPLASVPSGLTANPVGRVTATGGASLATATLRVALFHPNAY